MSDTIINIHGGNNQILPNATEAVQNFYGCQPADAGNAERQASDGLSPEALSLQPYINDAERLRHYVARLSECRSATELAQVIVSIKDRESKITAELMVKEKFIKLLLPLAPNVTKGTTIDNIRARINNVWSKKPRTK